MKRQSWKTRTRGSVRQLGKKFRLIATGKKRMQLPKITGKRRSIRRITLKTKLIVKERGKVRIKALGKLLPPKRWFNAKKKLLAPLAKKRGYKDSAGLVGYIWWRLKPERRLEIMKRSGKVVRFA